MEKNNQKDRTFWMNEPLIDETEIYKELAAKKGSILFLGRYSMSEVISVLAKKNFLKEARKRFLWPLAFDLDSSNYPSQRFQVFLRGKKPENLIADLKIRESEFLPEAFPPSLQPFPPQKALALEWLTIQNPLQKFAGNQIPFPGQIRPGLGLRKKVMNVFVYLARLMRKDCLLAFPAYFHNAVLFSRYFKFWNPNKEGEFLTIRQQFIHMQFKKLAWVVHLNCLRRHDGSIYEWKAEEQLYPLSRELKGYFDQKSYKEIVRQTVKTLSFEVDWEIFKRKSADYPFLCSKNEDLI